ncbi:MAG: SGNH/GDSL hydrolase family protein [Myxococcales bacterium]|nr:SGNH/GDSL hydrolase family protein [Myxococcales bacterium]
MRVEKITGATEWSDADSLPDEYHPTLGWVLKAGFRSSPNDSIRVTTNAQRFRNAVDFPAWPADGLRRLAVLGDSFVFGEEVDDEHTLPGFLQARLTNVEVLNLGVRGYGVGQMVLWFEEAARGLHVDDVLLVITLPSDPFRDPYPYYFRNKPSFSVEKEALQIDNVPVPAASAQSFLLRHSFLVAFLFGRVREVRSPERIEEVLATTAALCERLRETCRAKDARLWVALIGAPSWILQGERILFESQRVLGADLVRRGFMTLDLVPWEVATLEQEGAALVRPGGHFTPRGNCLLAGEIARRLPGLGDSSEPGGDAGCPPTAR